jgi:topoisomerase IA-like protein
MDYVKIKLKLSGDVRTVTADEADELIARKAAVQFNGEVETATKQPAPEKTTRRGTSEKATKQPAPETAAKPEPEKPLAPETPALPETPAE